MDVLDEKFYRARILERTDLASDLWTVRVEPGGSFSFKPGQYATLAVQTESKRIERAYSLVSSPLETQLEFFFELVPHGELTPRLYQLHAGDEVLMRKAAKGLFTLDQKSGRTNHFLVCTVTGIAPFVSYVRTLYRAWKEGTFKGEHHLFILNGASRSWEFGYNAELEQLAGELPWLEYIPTVSRPAEDTDWKGEVGRVDDVLRKYLDLWKLNATSCVAYLCGHPDMIENGKRMLKRIGFAREHLKEEVYWIPAKPAAT
jgi:ferredoxin--NADP+ reductase